MYTPVLKILGYIVCAPSPPSMVSHLIIAGTVVRFSSNSVSAILLTSLCLYIFRVKEYILINAQTKTKKLLFRSSGMELIVDTWCRTSTYVSPPTKPPTHPYHQPLPHPRALTLRPWHSTLVRIFSL